jgi:ABC-type dipeptide/oligopeptide/nickel transport system permease component
MTQDTGIPVLDNEKPVSSESASARNRILVIAGVILVLALIAGIVLAVVAMVRNPAQTETIRDIVIIFMAVEALIIGLVLSLLIVQIARLTDLLHNEIKPILDSTNETLSTLRGTTRFLSDNLVNPVVKVNSSMAAVRRALDLIKPDRSE